VGAGELVHGGQPPLVEDPEHGYGAVVTASGRVSVARSKQPVKPELPFTSATLIRTPGKRPSDCMPLTTRWRRGRC
jgi:hypothetical protein